MGKISQQVESGRILLSDGAWGTFLHQKGLSTGQCPEIWNVDRPDDVLDIARSYVIAGSNMIETNSFGGSRFKLEAYGLEDRVTELNRAAAEISREAAGEDRYVLGSIGPTGKFVVMGDVSAKELYDAFSEQAAALATGGVDAIIVETMSDIQEATAAVQAASENTDREIICTMTFEPADDGTYYTIMGVTPAQMAETLIEMNVDIIGANCGTGFRHMADITREIRTVNTDIPILIHANAGAPVFRDGETVFPETPDDMASGIPELIEAGANIIGGCCGTTPEYITKFAETIRNS
ncbi:MAG: homocysteine S-methyltransferase family protein [Candidatus Marinimicrobia bacterium]|nr:homocysteine S-methyltransferase family protein [Candidatus Neomarinimicrobiota bacterium]MCF7827637.1 homocysteine S-methyltransferase family protein [Candidatus Neomarinimicrobiota bacterium]MCF7881308.1 homocysteine S-methyltransferase family protein [Candidatus Neomarinimicrobiota bacterium]